MVKIIYFGVETTVREKVEKFLKFNFNLKKPTKY